MQANSALSGRRRGCRRLAGGVAALFLGLVVLAGPAAAAATPALGLFGSHEKRNPTIAPFVKWTGTLERYFGERKLEDAPCRDRAFNKCHLQAWKRFLASIKDLDPMGQIIEVNNFMNRAPYIVDPINYGVSDYWATPRQFLAKDGDCEDYAIAKYLSLRALGYPADAMRIVVLQDENLDLAHAVLAVYIGPRIYILDNQIKQVVPHERIRHYRPIYSINETAWWLHRP